MKKLLRLAVAASLLVVAAMPASAQAVTFHDSHGLRVQSVKQDDTRVVHLVVATGALPKPVNVDVVLPAGYGSRPKRRYPVIYLMHGATGTAADWITQGQAEKLIGDRPLIAVIPDITIARANSGWCTNWANGAQRWETFHIDQLVPWIDSNLRTRTSRSERAIAGLSEGGYCATSYAARHPDLFGAAFGFSGVVEAWYDPHVRAGATALINAFEAQDGLQPDSVFGDPVTNAMNYAAHDAGVLAENLRHTYLHMFWGNGAPGPFDTPDQYPTNNFAGEALANVDNAAFESRLESLGIPARYDAYGAGTHTWPYWRRDLQTTLAEAGSEFAHPRPDQSQFTYTSGDGDFAVYGWSVAMKRSVREFATLQVDGRRGFQLAGSGSAAVVTAALYRPHARYTVTLSGDRLAATSKRAIADARGRLHLDVPLGPSNTSPADVTEAHGLGAASSVYTTTARILRLRRAG